MAVLFAAGALACSAEQDAAAPAVGEVEQAFVVGTDDRADVYAYPDASWRARAQASTGALISTSKIDASNPANVIVNSSTLGQAYGVCSTERFVNQPAAAFCSGTLIDDDLVLTAGHCLTAATCASTSFVFDYRMTTATTRETVTVDDVYQCAELLVRRYDQYDHAIFRLDRPVAGHQPVTVAGPQPLTQGQNVMVIGHPSGLPTKLTPGPVSQPLQDGTLLTFSSPADIFAGNSGSGVLDAAHRVVGVAINSAATDYVSNGSCNVVNTLPTGQVPGTHQYAFWAVRELCNSTSADTAICGSAAPVCGDAQCEPREQYLDCPQDCPPLPPPEWTCGPSQYVGNIDGQCWCGCGAVDPDCEKPNAFMALCSFNQSCGAADACSTTHVVPGRLQAVKFARFQDSTPQHIGNCNTQSPVDMETSSDVHGSRCNISSTTAGEWLEYDVTVAQAGAFDLGLRLASNVAGTRVRVHVDGQPLGGSLTVPNQGWQTFSTVAVPSITLSAGAHTVRVTFETGNANLAYLSFARTFQAEDAFDVDEGVVESIHGGYSGAGYINIDNASNTFFVHLVTSPPTAKGAATLRVRYANGSTSNRPIAISVNGVNAGTLNAPPTGAWTTWVTSPSLNIRLTSGNNDVVFSSVTSDGMPNIDRFHIAW